MNNWSQAELYAFHLISEHADYVAVMRPFAANVIRHHSAHTGEGTHAHPFSALHFDVEKIETVLGEAEASLAPPEQPEFTHVIDWPGGQCSCSEPVATLDEGMAHLLAMQAYHPVCKPDCKGRHAPDQELRLGVPAPLPRALRVKSGGGH